MNAALNLEHKAIRQIERAHMKYQSGKTYIACERYDFRWSEEELFDFECMWHEGKTLLEIAEYFKRPEMEILFLAADRGDLGKIKPRKGGLIGEMSTMR